MLVIWTTDPHRRVMQSLASPLCGDPALPVKIHSSADPPSLDGVKMVLALGREPLAWLQANGVAPKGRKITGLRKHLHTHVLFPVPTLISYAPGICDVDYAYYTDLLTDVTLAMRFVRTGTLTPMMGLYQYVHDFTGLVARCKAKWEASGKAVAASYDVETKGLDPYHPDAFIVSLQGTCAAGQADVVYVPSRMMMQALRLNPRFMEALTTYLTAPWIKLCAAGGKYDLNWTREHFAIDCTNFTFDTLLAGSLLDENRSNDLGTHTKLMVPNLGGYSDIFDAVVDKSKMDLVQPTHLLPYAGGDADATLQVAGVEKKLLNQQPDLARFYHKLLHPAARAYEHVESTGVLIDQDRYLALESEVRGVMNDCVRRAKKLVGGRLVAKHLDVKRPDYFNLTKSTFLIDYMFGSLGLGLKPQMFTAGSEEKEKKTGLKQPSTAMEHLLLFADRPEAKAFLDIMKEYTSASKTLTTYIVSRDKDGKPVKGFLTHLRCDGRFHPSFFLFNGNPDDDDDGGTNTGRTSAKAPAIQTVPKHTTWAEKLRRCYIAPPGHLIMSRDFSQGELRIMACLSGDPTMLEAYRQGMDLHALTSGVLSGRSYEQMMQLKISDPHAYAELRQLAKAVNFGLIFLISAEGLQVYAGANYGVALSLQQSRVYHSGFFETYPEIGKYHTTQKRLAHAQGFVCNPLGRVRHLPLINSHFREAMAKAERQSVNAPTQSTLSDLALFTTALEFQRGWHVDAPCIAMIHDQLLNYVPEDKAHEYAARGRQSMETLPLHELGWLPPIPFKVDVTLGANLADQKEV